MDQVATTLQHGTGMNIGKSVTAPQTSALAEMKQRLDGHINALSGKVEDLTERLVPFLHSCDVPTPPQADNSPDLPSDCELIRDMGVFANRIEIIANAIRFIESRLCS